MFSIMEKTHNHLVSAILTSLFLFCAASASYAQEESKPALIETESLTSAYKSKDDKGACIQEGEKNMLMYVVNALKKPMITVESKPEGCVTLTLTIKRKELYVRISH